MTEWYVYAEWGIPKEVIMGRRHAVDRLLAGFRVTADIRKGFARYIEGNTPDLGASVGVGERTWDGRLERSLTRTTGPGTEV